MIFLLKEILRTLLRIEKKTDELLKLALRSAETKPGHLPLQVQPMDVPVPGPCPLCQKPMTYKAVELSSLHTTVPIRVCGCEPVITDLPVKGD